MHPAIRTLILAIALAPLPAIAFGQDALPSESKSPDPTRPRPIIHIHLQGDLDCTKLAADFTTSLNDARARTTPLDSSSRPRSPSPPLLLLELDGRRWRSDVILAIAKAIKSDTAPIACIVYINSPSAPVGTGPAALGLIADACFIAPHTRITFDPADDLAPSMPDGTDTDAIDRGLRALAWTSLQDRHADPLLTTLIPRPTAALYAVKFPSTDTASTTTPGPSFQLATNPSASGDQLTIVRPTGDAPMTLSLDADTAVRIGFCDGLARSPTECLSRRGIRASRTANLRVESGLPDARRALERTIRAIDEARRQAAAAIDEVARLHSKDAFLRQHRVAQEQSPLITEARAHLETAEHCAADYPELLRAPPPGATSIAQTRTTIQKSWRDLFQSRRVDLDKLSDRLRTLADKTPTSR